MTKRILITGSREWDDRDAIKMALAIQWWKWNDDFEAPLEVVTLVSGNCPSGADALAEEIWEAWGFPVERHPANWKRDGKYRAGKIRNQLMVDLGADVCLAFRRNYSRGTTHCANAATMAGIETIWFTEDEDD